MVKRLKKPVPKQITYYRVDMSSPAALARFKKAANTYTLKATSTREIAVKTLKSERIMTKTGKLRKPYAPTQLKSQAI